MLTRFGGNNQLESLKLNFYDGSTSEFSVNVNVLWELWKCALLDYLYGKPKTMSLSEALTKILEIWKEDPSNCNQAKRLYSFQLTFGLCSYEGVNYK